MLGIELYIGGAGIIEVVRGYGELPPTLTLVQLLPGILYFIPILIVLTVYYCYRALGINAIIDSDYTSIVFALSALLLRVESFFEVNTIVSNVSLLASIRLGLVLADDVESFIRVAIEVLKRLSELSKLRSIHRT